MRRNVEGQNEQLHIKLTPFVLIINKHYIIHIIHNRGLETFKKKSLARDLQPNQMWTLGSTSVLCCSYSILRYGNTFSTTSALLTAGPCEARGRGDSNGESTGEVEYIQRTCMIMILCSLLATVLPFFLQWWTPPTSNQPLNFNLMGVPPVPPPTVSLNQS